MGLKSTGTITIVISYQGQNTEYLVVVTCMELISICDCPLYLYLLIIAQNSTRGLCIQCLSLNVIVKQTSKQTSKYCSAHKHTDNQMRCCICDTTNTTKKTNTSTYNHICLEMSMVSISYLLKCILSNLPELKIELLLLFLQILFRTHQMFLKQFYETNNN